MNKNNVISLAKARKHKKPTVDDETWPIWDDDTWAQRRKRAIPEVMNLMDIDEARARAIVKWREKELKKEVDPVTADPEYLAFRIRIQWPFMNENERARWQQFFKNI